MRTDWDAETYDRVAQPQFEWAHEVLERLDLRGDEVVLDAGCGSGRVTALLVERLPGGRVIAVDGSPAMVRRARERLGSTATVLHADLSELVLDEPVDAVFSNAVFHWIADQDRLFRRLGTALRPGGRLAAQCGGEGNVASLGAAIREVTGETPFGTFFEGHESPWHFLSPRDAAPALEAAGFVDVECWLEPKLVTPEDPRDYLSTVTLGFHLERLPTSLRESFLDAIVERMPEPLTLDYVRLNIVARRGAGCRPSGP